MKAMLLKRTASLQDNPEPLKLTDIPVPNPAADEVLIRVSACGVCHTELDEIEGRTPPPILPIVSGHEVIGRVAETGDRVTKLEVGDRVGVGWIFRSSGEDDENISDEFVATGRDANGGYAEYMTVHERYAYRIPDSFNDYEAAPKNAGSRSNWVRRGLVTRMTSHRSSHTRLLIRRRRGARCLLP